MIYEQESDWRNVTCSFSRLEMSRQLISHGSSLQRVFLILHNQALSITFLKLDTSVGEKEKAFSLSFPCEHPSHTPPAVWFHAVTHGIFVWTCALRKSAARTDSSLRLRGRSSLFLGCYRSSCSSSSAPSLVIATGLPAGSCNAGFPPCLALWNRFAPLPGGL